MYKALNKKSNDHVAVKKTKRIPIDRILLSTIERLIKCDSPFIVRYNDMIWNDNELWVESAHFLDGIDCNRVLFLWISWYIPSKEELLDRG